MFFAVSVHQRPLFGFGVGGFGFGHRVGFGLVQRRHLVFVATGLGQRHIAVGGGIGRTCDLAARAPVVHQLAVAEFANESARAVPSADGLSKYHLAPPAVAVGSNESGSGAVCPPGNVLGAVLPPAACRAVNSAFLAATLSAFSFARRRLGFGR